MPAFRNMGTPPEAGLLLALAVCAVCEAQPESKPDPTLANISYGPHERNVLDLWIAESDQPTPLVVYIHGGGFRRGSKESLKASILKGLLEAGISVAAVNYRLLPQSPLPLAHHDCRRALQFVRSRAGEWNIDKRRVGAFGGSAGAQLCMYLAFHDEMAEAASREPLHRESTRLACVATNGGQTTMDVHWWEQHIPGYEQPHRDFREAFGASTEAAYLAACEDVSALSLISRDDPPILMRYAMRPDDPVPDDSERAQGWKVHHVRFGMALKERMDALGIESHVVYPGVGDRSDDALLAFFGSHLHRPQ
jgi:acetyl esterase/lipase